MLTLEAITHGGEALDFEGGNCVHKECQASMNEIQSQAIFTGLMLFELDFEGFELGRLH